MSTDDVTQWITDNLEHLEPGAALELAPWQVEVLEAIYHGRPWPGRADLHLRARSGRRREDTLRALVAAALAGERIAVVSATSADARRLLEAATLRLEQTLELIGRRVPTHARRALDEAHVYDGEDRDQLEGTR